MTLVLYVSGHGFGHAARSLEVAGAIAARQPGARIVVRTSVARWFLERSARVAVEFEHVEVDTGMVQRGSLRLDEDETAREAARFYATFEARVAHEAEFLRAMQASIVVGDIPPLAFSAASRAGVPSVALGNFTWDWIYSIYPQFERLAPGVMATIRSAYARADLALRLPFHGGFAPMARLTRDLPLVARRSVRTRQDVRGLLGLSSARPVAIASFGAYGVDLPLEDIARANNLSLIVTDHEAGPRERAHDGVLRLTSRDLEASGLRYEDLVAASDVVVSKPGYGIVSECIANGAALVYTSRDRFVEYDVFVNEMPTYLRCQFVPQRDLEAGRWADAISAVLRQPSPPGQLDLNGADVAADAILSTLR